MVVADEAPARPVGTERDARWPRVAASGGVISVAAVIALAKLAGGGREVVVARDFGISAGLDRFLLAFALVSVGIDALAGAVPSALIPVFHRTDGTPPADQVDRVDRVDRSARADRADEVLGGVLPALAVGVVLVGAAVAAASGPLALVVAGGFDEAGRAAVGRSIVALAPTIVFGVLTAVATSCLQDRGRFVAGAVPTLANPVVTIAILVAAERPSTATLATAFALGYLAELVVAVAVAAASGVRIRRAPGAVARADRAAFVAQLGPVAVGLLVLSAMTVIDQAVAAHLGRGQVATLGYGIRLPGFAAAVGIAALGSVVLPGFARAAAARRWDHLRASFRGWVWVVLGLGTAGAAVLALAAAPLIELAFARGAFTAADVTAAASVQRVAAWQLPFHLLAVVSTRLLSARHRARSILGLSVAAAVANLVLDIAFARWWGIEGIALSTTVVIAGMGLASARLAWAAIPGAEAEART